MNRRILEYNLSKRKNNIKTWFVELFEGKMQEKTIVNVLHKKAYLFKRGEKLDLHNTGKNGLNKIARKST